MVDKEGKVVSQPTLTVEELRAVVDEAHGQQKKSRATRTAGSACIERWTAMRLIEHGLLDDAASRRCSSRAHGSCATLGVYYTDWSPENTQDGKRDRARANEHEASFKKALKQG